MNWYLKVLKEHYADFNGRARRKEYWMFTLFHIIIIIAIMLLSFVLLGGENYNNEEPNPFVFIGLGIYILATFIPSLALSVRRLHDVGKSGWFYLITLIPYIGGLILFVFACKDSENGANKWGENPKGIGNNEAINEIGRE
ncbi:DUF805 domain-containing protein [uncultured Polaribacter sp.]|uniref:DUF805 domain-containing protein n=1 Tax=uncultured Polaribacter sp. TaxID=174711 RepID=UPI002610B8E9|nr:DUF805 domain-containing protein [uncultured Polaribacter sp.]